MTLRSSQRDREAAERALDRWGAWRGLAGSLELRNAVVEALTNERERIALIADGYAGVTVPVDPGDVARLIAWHIRDGRDPMAAAPVPDVAGAAEGLAEGEPHG